MWSLMLNNFLRLICIIFIAVFFQSCSGSGDDVKADNTGGIAKQTSNTSKHLNINILIDLSNRIDPAINKREPSQKERDIQIIKSFCSAFKSNVDAHNAFKAQAKIRVFFDPEPNDPQVASIAQSLNASCIAGNTPDAAKRNKLIYRSLDSNFSDGLNKIYNLALSKKDYPGSNIFRFMKDDVKRCIEEPSKFRNVLVILTDGYIYSKNEKYNEGNRYSYIERNFDHFNKFRNRELLKSQFDSQNFGLIKVNDNLQDLEVVVMEVSPPVDYPVDYDIINRYWSKWLTEMGVEKFDIVKTDQPVYTEKRINDFLSK